MVSIFDLTRSDLGELLADEPRFRADQVWRSLYRQLRRPAEMTELPVGLRERLERTFPPGLTEVTCAASRSGETVKWLWALAGGSRIETVLMDHGNRCTVCVSTQAGCAMGCTFCATGQVGFDRQLSIGEIVEQVVVAARTAAPGRLSNVVFMGMGEPMANYEALLGAIGRIHADLGISARSLVISTVGLVPGMQRLASEPLPVRLAISLHAANDALRDQLVPINRRYPLEMLMEACDDYLGARRRRITFEWALISGVNDAPGDARELAALAVPRRAHVNLIPLNPTPGSAMRAPGPREVSAFCERLLSLGVNVTVRRNRGAEIDAACGQLRASAEVPVSAPAPSTSDRSVSHP